MGQAWKSLATLVRGIGARRVEETRTRGAGMVRRIAKAHAIERLATHRRFVLLARLPVREFLRLRRLDLLRSPTASRVHTRCATPQPPGRIVGRCVSPRG